MYALKFIYKNLDYFRKKFILIFFIGIIDGSARFLVPVVLAEFTKNEFGLENFKKISFLIIFLVLISLLLQWLIRKFGEALAMQFRNHIKLKYFKKLERMPAQDIIKQHSGYILSLINKVADMSGSIIFGIFWCFAHSIANISLFFFFTARESLGIAFLNSAVLIIFLIVSIFLSKKIIIIADELNIKRASLSESYVDFIVNILTIKKLNIYSFAKKKLNNKTDDTDNSIQKLQDFHANRWFVLHGLYGLAFLSTIIFLLFQISQGIVNLSVLILFVAAYGFMRVNIERLSEHFKNLMELKAYIISLEKAVSPSENFNQGNTQIKKWHKIKFQNIFFKYSENNKIIKIPDFKIKKYEKICVMGESGEGKTTLLNLMADFLKPQKGERSITINR